MLCPCLWTDARRPTSRSTRSRARARSWRPEGPATRLEGAFTRARAELAVGTAGSPAPDYEAMLRLKSVVRQALTGDSQVRLVSNGVWHAALGWTAEGRFAAAFMPPGMGMVDDPLSDR